MIRLRQTRLQPYVRLGLVALGFGIPFVALGVRETYTRIDGDDLVWQTLTGALLLALLVYQWRLLLNRALLPGRPHMTLFRVHRYTGVACVLLYILHAVSLGYSLTSWMSLAFLVSAVTGMMNRQVMNYTSKPVYYAWYTLHLASSVLLAPLIVVHIWMALAYH